ncbi:MAG: hypothetical protein RR946_00445 [Clostridia bacterium]
MHPYHPKRILAAILGGLLVLGLLAPCLAEPAVKLECEMGYSGTITYIRKLPINVRLINQGADASGVLAVNINRDNNQFDRYELPVAAASGATVEVTLPVTLTTKQADFTVEWLVNGQLEAQQVIKPQTVMNPTSFTVGVLSDQPQALSYMNITKFSDPLKRNELWQTVPLTLQSFPEDVESLRFFDALAVDGLDLNLLSLPQKTAMEAWLLGGGVVLLGGGAQAASAYPYFTSFTGITAGALVQGGDISTELMSLLKLSETANGQNVMLVPLEGATGMKAGACALVDTTRVGDGYVLTAAFSLSDKPFSTWQGKNVLWQRMLLQYTQSRYQEMMDQRISGTTSLNSFDNRITDNIGIETGNGMLLPMGLLLVFVFLAGFGSYFLLKKLDKREWMWATVPALAMVFSFAMWGLSGVLDMQEPVATGYTVACVSEDGTVDSFSAISAAKANTERMTFSLEKGTVDLDNSRGVYYSGEDMVSTPTTLRCTYTYGEPETVSYPETAAWEQNRFFVRDVPLADCSMSGTCTFDGEGLSFTVQNKSNVAYEDGVIITDYGFVSVPALLPGQTTTAALKPEKKPSSGSAVKDGVMLDSTERQNNSYYNFIQVYANSEKLSRMSAEEQRKWELRRAMMDTSDLFNTRGRSTGSNFHYITFSKDLADLRPLVDGKPVVRFAKYGMLNVTLAYQPISKDGTAHFLGNSFPSYVAELDHTGKPQLGAEISQNRGGSMSLNTKPMIGFDMSEMPKGFHLTKFDVNSAFTYYAYRACLYHVKTGKWDEVKLLDIDNQQGKIITKLKLPKLEDYINDQQILYVRFESHGNTDLYGEISLPRLTIDGRLE